MVITGAAGNSPEEPNDLLKESLAMLRFAILFLVIALLAALFGFGGIASDFMFGAKVLFFVFLVLAVLAFLGGYSRRYT